MREPFGQVKLVKVIRGFLSKGSVDNEPVHGSSHSPISSDWAYETESTLEEHISISKHLLKGLMNAICEEDFSWDEFDLDEVDTDDVTEIVEEGLDKFVKVDGDTLTGQLKLEGNGIVWDDLRTPINSLKLSGTKPPTWTSYKSGEVLAFTDALVANEESVFFNIQIPHNYKEGTPIIIHVHFVPEDNSGGNVYWMLTYSWATLETAFPTATTTYIAGACGTTTDAHKIAYFPEIDGSPNGVNKLISSMLICKLQRHSSNALDTYNGKSAYLLEIDAHYQKDSLG